MAVILKYRLIVFSILVIGCNSSTTPADKPAPPLKTQHNVSEDVIQSEIKKFQTRSKSLVGTSYPFLKLLSKEAGIPGSVFEQRVVILNFSFANCKPCILELEGISLLYNKLKDNKNVLFLSITPDDDSTVNAFVKQHDLPYMPVSVERDIGNKLNFESGYPTNLILKRGTIKRVCSGGFPTKQQSTNFFMGSFLATIEDLLDSM
ncbi:peroxiredoxin family protein [Niabella drilacis]|nr:thioredoxin-like domain-containing protein [Niabella drilacis]